MGATGSPMQVAPPRLIEAHILPQAVVLFEAERADALKVVEHEPVVPDAGLPHVVPGPKLHLDGYRRRLSDLGSDVEAILLSS